MTSDEPRDFSGVHLEDVNFSGARLHNPNFEDVKITDAWLRNADISGYIGGLRLNGVEVAPLVKEELFRLYPERRKLEATDPGGLAEGWALVENAWADTIVRAGALPEALLYEPVDGEWSFVETLRHLLLATDCWFVRMVRGEGRAYHPWGIGGAWLADPTAWGLDYEAKPMFENVVSARADHMAMVKTAISELTPAELERTCTPPDSPGHPTSPHTVLQCLHVVLEEEWEHNKYANRDLGILEAKAGRNASPSEAGAG